VFNQIIKLRQERHRNIPLLTELGFKELQRCRAYGAKNRGAKNAGQKLEGKIKSQAHESISQTVIVEYWLGDCIISSGLFSFAVSVGYCV
jgi:hypothetical protein